MPTRGKLDGGGSDLFQNHADDPVERFSAMHNEASNAPIIWREGYRGNDPFGQLCGERAARKDPVSGPCRDKLDKLIARVDFIENVELLAERLHLRVDIVAQTVARRGHNQRDLREPMDRKRGWQGLDISLRPISITSSSKIGVAVTVSVSAALNVSPISRSPERPSLKIPRHRFDHADRHMGKRLCKAAQ